jgi:chemosensory pili system protein ChpA (sensor histidine kinase/response regulator)
VCSSDLINNELQQGLMGTLMVPFSRQLQRLERVVRQTAEQNGKRARAEFSGADSEMDRNVLERMSAPLEHLLRNSVVHGIEEPAVRAATGKDPEGVVHVSLKREGSQLLIEVRDDGRGLDYSAIRAQALKRGLIRADLRVSETDLARFIFAPGFSTARTLTQDAGRCIGMDVVASEVKQLGGSVDLASEAGRGTRFRIRLPLMLAVSQALVVQVGEELYAVPLTAIEGITRVPRESLPGMLAGEPPRPLIYGGQDYRLYRLSDLLGLPAEAGAGARTLPAVLIRVGEGLGGGERRVAILADRLIGNREIVSKAAGPILGSVSGVTGATIMADGRVMLILDLPALIQEAARRALGAESTAEVPSPPPAPTPLQAPRKLVMVVDDSITIRRVSERLLSRRGYRVLTAKDGLDAIAQLQSESPDAILLDIEMPRADGFEVAAFVRNTARIARTPIIMITSRSGEKHREHARQLGVDRYLTKPFQEDQLLAELQSLIGREEALA